MSLKKFCVAFALVCQVLATSAQEGLTTDEQRWVDTINVVVEKTARADITVKVKIYAEDTGSSVSVLAASYKESVCTMHLSSRYNRQDAAVQSLATNPEVARLAVTAHEYGHCVHRAAQQQGTSTPKADAWPEAFADAYAIAWISTYCPHQLTAATEFLHRLRKKDRRGAYALGLYVIKSADSFTLNPERPIMEKTLDILRRTHKE